MIKSIIFDVDGVVFKSQDACGNYFWSSSIRKDLGVRGFLLKKFFLRNGTMLRGGKLVH